MFVKLLNLLDLFLPLFLSFSAHCRSMAQISFSQLYRSSLDNYPILLHFLLLRGQIRPEKLNNFDVAHFHLALKLCSIIHKNQTKKSK